MKIETRSEKIISIFEDIEGNEIDLRPDFQRGEVWLDTQKKLLIDSIFRGWHIPPIHLVRSENGTSEVLDGQQRLTTIRDFINDKFSINGLIEPSDEEIKSIHRLKYSELKKDQRRKFDRTLLTIYEITEYNHGEPGELFHRLNQLVKLTSDQPRNSHMFFLDKLEIKRHHS